MQLTPTIPTHPEQSQALIGRWTTAKVYGYVCNFKEDVLGNWRYKDRKAGRECAL